MSRFHVPMRDSLVVLLTVTTGAVDAASFLALGHVFGSVITGNLVLLGVAAGAAQPPLAVRSGVALAGYVAGVAIGAPLAVHRHETGETWPPSVTVTLAAELGVLAVFSVVWELAGAAPRGGVQLALVAILAAAILLKTMPAWLPAVVLMPLCLVIVSSVAGFEWVRNHLTPRRR